MGWVKTSPSGIIKTVSQSSSEICLAALTVRGEQAGVHVLFLATPWPVVVLMSRPFREAGVKVMASVSFDDNT